MIAALLLAGATPLPALLERLRLSVADVPAITDLQVCPLNQRGDQHIAFARPQQPRRYYVVRWKDGRATRLLDTGFASDSTGLYGAMLGRRERDFEACRWVPAAEIAAAWETVDAR